jgi:hypothetical protein
LMVSQVGAGSAKESVEEILAARERAVVRFEASLESSVRVERRVMMERTDTALRCLVVDRKTASTYDE